MAKAKTKHPPATPTVQHTSHRTLAGVLLATMLAGAAPPPIDGDNPVASPGFDTGPAPVFAQPRHDPPLDPVIAQLVVERLIRLRLLDTSADAQDAAKTAAAIRGFQSGLGLKPTGVLDRKTLALLAL